MRISKECYTLNIKDFKSVSQNLAHIKVLEEKIDATKVTLDTNSRTILCLSMSLPPEYQYLVRIWAVTPSMTAEKARTMVEEASRQYKQLTYNPRVTVRKPSHHKPSQLVLNYPALNNNTATSANTPSTQHSMPLVMDSLLLNTT